MIDINELRRLAQEATPGPWINHGRQPSVGGLPHSAVAAKTLLARVYSEAYGDVEQEAANAEFIAAANPNTISELLNRLEAAEKELAELRSSMKFRTSLIGRTEAERDALRIENEALRAEIIHIKEVEFPRKAQAVADGWRDKCERLEAKIEQMERQEPVAEWTENRFHYYPQLVWNEKYRATIGDKLYTLPGAQPAQWMNMQTADQITQAFKAELQALLDKYGAELSARDTWQGYPECGEDVRMLVDVPAIYDADHNCLREYTEIDLGSWVPSTQAMPKEAKP